MSLSGANFAELAILASVLLLVISLWSAVVWLWALRRSARRQEVEKRLGLGEEGSDSQRVLRLWHDGREVTTAVPGRRQGLTPWRGLRVLLEDAGWDIPVSSAVLGVLGLATLVCLVTILLSGRVLAGLGVAALLFLVLWAMLKQRAGRRTALFERQLIDALELSARSLRAGHPLSGAFILVAEEIPHPVGTIFAGICQQEQLGMSFGDALQEAAARSRSSDMKLFATSVGIQVRSGGNLADMMDRLVAVMRDRIRLNRRARVLTAQTQFSKRVLIILPFAIFVLLNVLRPGYMEPMYTTFLGKVLLGVAVASLTVGAWVMNRMAELRY